MMEFRVLCRQTGKLFTSFEAPVKWGKWLEEIAAEQGKSVDDVFENVMKEWIDRKLPQPRRVT